MCTVHNIYNKSIEYEQLFFFVHTYFSVSQVSAPNKNDILQKICKVHIISLEFEYPLFRLVQEFSHSESIYHTASLRYSQKEELLLWHLI
jgi:hypothetical protein